MAFARRPQLNAISLAGFGGNMRSSVVVLAGLALAATVAQASFENVATVLQPLDHDGMGLIPCVATYTGYDFDSRNPTSVVLLTTAANSMVCDGKPCSRNEAARLGVRFVSETKPNRDGGAPVTAWPRLQNDTLQVRVDVSSVPMLPDNEETVALTLWCGLRNVRRFSPRVNFVEYRIEGSPPLGRYSGIYSLVGVEPVCPMQVWDFKQFGPTAGRDPANKPLQPTAPHGGQK